MNTKAIAAIMAVLILASVATVAIPVQGKGNNNPNKLWGAQTYLLNILGKKSDWNGDPSYESTDRHTMFVPEDVDEWMQLSPYFEHQPYDPKIWVNQGSEFAVMDPNMFDDGECNLTIGAGRYEVYFVALGKPGSTATLEGWIYNVTANEYLLKVGEVSVSHNKKPNWQSGTGMFYISESEAGPLLAALGMTWAELLAALGYPPDATQIWIFDLINWLATQTGYEYAYLWKLVGGCKHIQIRFYKVG